jgi:hypothetical protein
MVDRVPAKKTLMRCTAVSARPLRKFAVFPASFGHTIEGGKPMRKLVFVAVAALLAVPAYGVAATPPTPNDRAAAVKQCSTERNGMGAAAFKLLYGTNSNRSNAFGKCVSKLAKQNGKNRSNASSQCRAERAADAAAFREKYGTGHKKSNAFGKCVSQKAKAAAAAQQQARVNAAKACWTERKADPAAFKAKYGTNAHKSNAFGKCVSSHVKHSTS